MTAAEAARRHAGTLLLFGGAALWLLILGNPAETLERQLFDSALRARATLGRTPPADPRIVILGVDDEDLAGLASLEEEYRAAARAIDEATELGASVLIFDTIYVRGTPELAAPIIDAIGKGAPVVLAEAVRAAAGGEENATRLRSFPFRSSAAAPGGLINVAADADGTYRAYSVLHWDGASFQPSLALSGWLVAHGLRWDTDVTQPQPGVIRWPELSPDGTRVEEREFRQRAEGTQLLNFRGGWREGAGFGHLTLRGLHELHTANATQHGRPLAGKILFFAYVATGVADLGATCFGPNEPLVLLHATALNDLLQGSFISRAARWIDALAVLFLAALAGAMSLSERKAWLLAVWFLGALAIVLIAAFLLFEARLLLSTIALLMIWSIAVVFEMARRHTAAVAQRRRLHDTMGMYFSPRVLTDVLQNPGRLQPKRVEITTLLTDLRNSTDLAERLGPEGMLELLNSIFAVENRAVFAEDGSMEKPVGDQFLAYWGAPDPQPDGADRALRAALALISGLQDLRETFDRETQALFGYGVALHAGRSLIGNIGSAQFYHYGPVGDLLNATARVESLTKYYGVLMLVTRNVYDRFSTPPEARVLDRVVVKGKTNALELLEVRNPSSPSEFTEIATSYAEAYAVYQRGDFGTAARLFARTSAVDRPSAVMARRCEELRSHPPDGWDGTYTFLTK